MHVRNLVWPGHDACHLLSDGFHSLYRSGDYRRIGYQPDPLLITELVFICRFRQNRKGMNGLWKLLYYRAPVLWGLCCGRYSGLKSSRILKFQPVLINHHLKPGAGLPENAKICILQAAPPFFSHTLSFSAYIFDKNQKGEDQYAGKN